MIRKQWARRHIEEAFVKGLMIVSFAFVAGSLGLILWTVIVRGLPALSWDMITQSPKGGFYMGKEGGVFNAIIGSLYLAGGGTLIALIVSLPIALYLETYLGNSEWGRYVRLALDVLWGIPSIVYGAFGFAIMIAIGLRASLLAGIIVLALVELPIMVRAMDEYAGQREFRKAHCFLLGSPGLRSSWQASRRELKDCRRSNRFWQASRLSGLTAMRYTVLSRRDISRPSRRRTTGVIWPPRYQPDVLNSKTARFARRR